ncbi:DUF4880 domain-containing protein [Acidovorax sp. NCPPB 3576]|uniref:DUF4880 domain-containing protein n=1 Tax=Acidovorax sp. NCPPB 3576 TaxID=2940488 RepID=UPI00234A190B|nr:DUF4880 domain-containing protein [Acidovorax sp. NCPPB 3576]WCM87228.1 DUF4880 domain-containing protein [Acidovorax sp. NCPPB 3576]
MTQADPHWAVAWDWVQREYDHENFDAAAREAMTRWLLADDAHRAAYEKAARLWLLAGLAAPVVGLEEIAPQHERSKAQD